MSCVAVLVHSEPLAHSCGPCLSKWGRVFLRTVHRVHVSWLYGNPTGRNRKMNRSRTWCTISLTAILGFLLRGPGKKQPIPAPHTSKRIPVSIRMFLDYLKCPVILFGYSAQHISSVISDYSQDTKQWSVVLGHALSLSRWHSHI